MKKYNCAFLPSSFSLTNWESIEPFYTQLLARDIDTLEKLKQFLVDWDKLEGVLQEEIGWRFINTTRNTADQIAKERYDFYITNIQPHLASVRDQLNKKALSSKESILLRQEISFDILFRKIENYIRCYREENIPIQTDIQLNTQKFSLITGAMFISIEGRDYTLPQATALLESTDRTFRKGVYEAIQSRRLEAKEELNLLYTTLVQQRHQVALNAGFKNFRDYAFVSKNRFDYTPQDCFTLHTAIQEEIVPLLNELATDRKKKLGLDLLQPFDHAVDLEGREPLRPFQDVEELIDKTIAIFEQLDPFLGNCLYTMKQMGHLDLDSRKNKAPGGYNYPLDEKGVPFIFMNAASTVRDLIVMFHEGGHAVHSFLVRELPLHSFKHCPLEVAELASMAMELLTMPYWNLFFSNPSDLKRAQKNHLIDTICCLPWIAAIDAFQHWVYENPYHTIEERGESWNRIFTTFSDSITDWSGYEEIKSYYWQKQLHLFKNPFYYIEYGIAQLGAIGIWKNAEENPHQALKNYLGALKLGYTASIGTIYQTAGVPFDFSREYIRSLAQFIRNKWNEL